MKYADNFNSCESEEGDDPIQIPALPVGILPPAGRDPICGEDYLCMVREEAKRTAKVQSARINKQYRQLHDHTKSNCPTWSFALKQASEVVSGGNEESRPQISQQWKLEFIGKYRELARQLLMRRNPQESDEYKVSQSTWKKETLDQPMDILNLISYLQAYTVPHLVQLIDWTTELILKSSESAIQWHHGYTLYYLMAHLDPMVLDADQLFVIRNLGKKLRQRLTNDITSESMDIICILLTIVTEYFEQRDIFF